MSKKLKENLFLYKHKIMDLIPFRKNQYKFLSHVLNFCIENDISFKMISQKYIIEECDDDSDEVMLNSGHFGGERGNYELAVATKKNKILWLSVLAHEYSHIIQLKEQCSSHRNLYKIKTKLGNALDNYFYWLEGKRVSKKIAHKCADLVRNMERDNEIRTVKLIKKWNLPVPLKYYIKKSNSYLFWYTFSKKYRQWSATKKPYEVNRIVEIMPDHFLPEKEYDNLPEEYENLAIKHCL